MESKLNDCRLSLADANRGRNHNFGLTLVRAVAILLVMLDHTCPRVDVASNESPLLQDALRALVAGPDAVLFFMLSGALLLPVTGGWRRFFGRRLARIAVPLILWSVVGAWVNCAYGWHNTWWMWHQIEWMLISPAWGPGWFLLVLCGIYLAMPVVSPWLQRASRRQVELMLILWLAAGLLPLLTYVMGVEHYENTVFGLYWNYFGYALAGFYFVRFPISASSLTRRTLTLVALTLVGVAMPILLYFYGGNYDIMANEIGNNLSVWIMASACLYFIGLSSVKSLGRPLNAVVKLVSRNAFGIYLCHFFVIRVVIEAYLPAVDNTWWMLPITIAGSLIVSELLRRIPFIGRYIV